MMTENVAQRVPVQRLILITGGGLTALLLALILAESSTRGLLFIIGLGMGVALYHASFGFSGAYRNLLTRRDMTGFTAQLVMLGAAILLFAPILAQGRAFDHGVTGSIAPVSLSMGLGAFMFGIGMQLGSGCASGVLYTAGGGNVRTFLVLIFFCLGAFWGSLDIGWWQTLPSLGSVSLARQFGWEVALPLQLGALAFVFFTLRRAGWNLRPIARWPQGLSLRSVFKGPWPLLISALVLALLNWATLVIAGHAWSITWAFTLWGAKAATVLGWDSTSSAFWNGGFQQGALDRSILADTTSIMNIAVLLGAMLAASLAGSFYKKLPIKPGPVLAAIIAGLLMGYGARLSYGCNIGAFFSGVASSSLHGWVWILCALPGNALGIRLRRSFGIN
jgi:uncharacterized protein